MTQNSKRCDVQLFQHNRVLFLVDRTILLTFARKEKVKQHLLHISINTARLPELQYV